MKENTGIKKRDRSKPSYEALYQENLALQQQLEDFRNEKRAIWRLLLETNRRLQSSSFAVKASVSSLLNYNIVWDGTNQHEFLETINSSIDQVGRLIYLLTLLFRLKAGSLELKRESQALPEIISVVQDHFVHQKDGPSLEVTLPREGKPVLVNYEYLIIAIEFFLEAANQNGAKNIQIEAIEEDDYWILIFGGMTESTIQVIRELLKNQDIPPESSDALAPDYQLGLFLAFHILRHQDIQIEVLDQSVKPKQLRISVPAQISK